jgi:hypothetical protein
MAERDGGGKRERREGGKNCGRRSHLSDDVSAHRPSITSILSEGTLAVGSSWPTSAHIGFLARFSGTSACVG